MVRELGMRDGFAGGSAVRYMDTRPQQPEIGEKHGHVWVECVSNGIYFKSFFEYVYMLFEPRMS